MAMHISQLDLKNAPRLYEVEKDLNGDRIEKYTTIFDVLHP